MSDVASWLAQLGLGKYADDFAAHEVDLASLVHLTEHDLKEIGLPLGPRRKVLAGSQSPDGSGAGNTPLRHRLPRQAPPRGAGKPSVAS